MPKKLNKKVKRSRTRKVAPKPKKGPLKRLTEALFPARKPLTDKKKLVYLETMETQANAAPAGATFGGSAMVLVKGKPILVNFKTKEDVLDLIQKIRVGEADLIL